jgi:hypothetical protein
VAEKIAVAENILIQGKQFLRILRWRCVVDVLIIITVLFFGSFAATTLGKIVDAIIKRRRNGSCR